MSKKLLDVVFYFIPGCNRCFCSVYGFYNLFNIATQRGQSVEKEAKNGI